MSVDEVGRDAGVDRLGLIGVDDRAAHEVRTRSAVRGEDRGEETTGARLGGGDREPAPAEPSVDRLHPLLELLERRRALRRARHAGRAVRRRGR